MDVDCETGQVEEQVMCYLEVDIKDVLELPGTYSANLIVSLVCPAYKKRTQLYDKLLGGKVRGVISSKAQDHFVDPQNELELIVEWIHHLLVAQDEATQVSRCHCLPAL